MASYQFFEKSLKVCFIGLFCLVLIHGGCSSAGEYAFLLRKTGLSQQKQQAKQEIPHYISLINDIMLTANYCYYCNNYST